VSAWLIAVGFGLLGMGVWAATLRQIDLGPIGFGLGATTLAGLGVFAGALIGSRLLNTRERESFFSAPPDEP